MKRRILVIEGSSLFIDVFAPHTFLGKWNIDIHGISLCEALEGKYIFDNGHPPVIVLINNSKDGRINDNNSIFNLVSSLRGIEYYGKIAILTNSDLLINYIREVELPEVQVIQNNQVFKYLYSILDVRSKSRNIKLFNERREKRFSHYEFFPFFYKSINYRVDML